MPLVRGLLLACLVFALNTSCSFAEDSRPPSSEVAVTTPAPVPLDKADIAWVLVSSALVLMMTAPGLSLFYGGLVRKKNILGVMMQCMFLMGIMSVVWVLWG